MEKFPLFVAIDHQRCPGRKIDLATDLDLIPFAFEEGSKLLCACRIVMVPTDSPLARGVRKLTNVSRNNG